MLTLAVLATGLAIAVVTDVRTRRIPNLLTASMAIAGFVIAVLGLGVTPAQAALGLLVGLVVMMPGHVIGATGAGDVKLMAVIGILVGPSVVLKAFLYTAVAGGTKYYYRVSAGNSAGEGVQSNETSATPTGTPPPPVAFPSTDGLDDFARAPAAGCGQRLTAEERARKRGNDERQRRQPQQQQRPIAYAPPLNGLIRNPLKEHQRRKLDDVLPFPLDQMNDHRHGQAGQGDQEQRG